jgi:hypothetical protein
MLHSAMSGVYTISSEAFLRRQQTFTKDDAVEAKYKSLFQKYECFNKLIYYHKGNTIKHVEKPKRVTQKTPNEDKKNPKKSFTNLWNILNESNYQKISHRIKFMLNENNIDNVIQDILSAAITHNIYRKYFLLLLNDIMVYSRQSGLFEHTQKTLIGMLEDYGSKHFVLEEIPCTVPEYDKFCKMQKHKLRVIQLVLLLIDIVDHDLLKNAMITFYTPQYIWQKCEKYLLPHIHDEYYLDILLNCILHMYENKSIWIEVKPHARTVLDNIRLSTMSMKMVFLIEKVTKLFC